MPRIFYILIFVASTQCMQSQNKSDQDFAQIRKDAFQWQISDRGIIDKRVIAAMFKVERHKFVPAEFRSDAYDDSPLPIGEGQTISQPYVVALMTELLNLSPTDRVLEIGTGSGYQAAILAELCREVYTIEVYKSLGERAEKILDELGYKNITVRVGDGYQGWPEKAPFNGIIVTCAPHKIPEPLKNQLAEGGRMVIPVGERYNQQLVLLTKHKGNIRQEYVLSVLFVPMISGDGKTY
ncbi:MAG TPA: protein-L-isoaspartate(D-aspartate) O-methyltransferase [Bacteroidales bacterium]